jgi:hypothetical protein
MLNKYFQKELETCFQIYPELKSMVENGTIDSESLSKLEKICYRKEYKHNHYPDLDIALELILRRIRNGEEWRDLSWIADAVEEEINRPIESSFDKFIGIDPHSIFNR